MSRKEKALKRLLARPADLTWAELKSVMGSFGYELRTSGGSGRKFVRSHAVFLIHEPHPGKILKLYQVDGAISFLRGQGDIE